MPLNSPTEFHGTGDMNQVCACWPRSRPRYPTKIFLFSLKQWLCHRRALGHFHFALVKARGWAVNKASSVTISSCNVLGWVFPLMFTIHWCYRNLYGNKILKVEWNCSVGLGYHPGCWLSKSCIPQCCSRVCVRRAFMAVHGSFFCNPVEEESTQKGT